MPARIAGPGLISLPSVLETRIADAYADRVGIGVRQSALRATAVPVANTPGKSRIEFISESMKVGIDNVNESPAQFHKFGVASAAAQSVRYFVLSAWIIVRLLISSILLFLEPIVGFILCTLAIVLAIVSVVLKLSGDVPKFPFWGALGVCVGLYLLFVLYSIIAIWATPKPHE